MRAYGAKDDDDRALALGIQDRWIGKRVTH